MSLLSRTSQPASLSSRRPMRRPSRMLPEPSVTGGWYSAEKTSGGRSSPSGSRKLCSSWAVRRAVLRGRRQAEVDLAALERLERDRAVAIIVVAHRVEIEAAARHRQILRPIVRIALQRDRPAEIDLRDLVGPAAQRRLGRGVVE